MNRNDTIDRARFRLMPAFSGTEVMDARFVSHSFAPHTHNSLMIGLISAGAMRCSVRATHYLALPGHLVIVNPGDVHYGQRDQRHGRELRYTAVYPSAALHAAAGVSLQIDIPSVLVSDPVLASLFAQALQVGSDSDLMVEALAALAARHGQQRSGDGPACSRAVRRAEQLMADCLDQPLTLERLAAVADVSTRHLIRSFRIVHGVTPAARLRGLRVARARQMLLADRPITDVALATGFADQAHLTRVFKAHTGTTPAVYSMATAI